MLDIQAELRRFHKNVEYYHDHQPELLQEYLEQWIGIFEDHVVGSATDYEQLLDLLDARGVPAEHTFIVHATTDDDVLILSA